MIAKWFQNFIYAQVNAELLDEAHKDIARYERGRRALQTERHRLQEEVRQLQAQLAAKPVVRRDKKGRFTARPKPRPLTAEALERLSK